MPSSVVKSFADKSGKSVAEVEKIWDKLKAEYGDNYKAIVGSFKKILKLNESESKMTFKEYLTDLSEGSVKEYVDDRLKKAFAKEGIQVKPIIKIGFTKYVFSAEPSDIELVNDGVNLIVKQGGKELEVYDNIKLNYSKCVSFILDKIENKVNEAQSQVQKVRGILGKPSSSTLKGNSEKATWKLKDGSTIEVDDAEARIYYMNKNGKDVIDVFTSVGQMKKALFQAGLLNESQDDTAKKAKQMRSNPDKEFIDYMMDFYGPKGIYIKDFTVAEIKTALAKRKSQRKDIPFEGDSFDRELVRDYVLAARGETNLEYNVSESEELVEDLTVAKVKNFIKKINFKNIDPAAFDVVYQDTNVGLGGKKVVTVSIDKAGVNSPKRKDDFKLGIDSLKKEFNLKEYDHGTYIILTEASKVKPFIKKVGKKSWAIKIEALGSDQGFPEYNFGQQIDPSRKVKTWKDGAKKGYVDAKGKATLQAVKDWVKENNPKEFYASWESDSSSYKDDSVEIFYK